jgi:hypothetical protein
MFERDEPIRLATTANLNKKISLITLRDVNIQSQSQLDTIEVSNYESRESNEVAQQPTMTTNGDFNH